MAEESEHERTLREILGDKSPPARRRKARRIKPDAEAGRELAEGMLEARRAQREAELREADAVLVGRLIERLEAEWGHSRACPYCGHDEWAVGLSVLALDLLRGTGTRPMFEVTCKNCGNTALVNPEVHGLWPSGGAEENEGADQ